MLASLVKKWKKIICYDNNEFMLGEVNKYFKDGLSLPIETVHTNSYVFDFDYKEPTIVIGNLLKLTPDRKEEIKNNKNILAIFNGQEN